MTLAEKLRSLRSVEGSLRRLERGRSYRQLTWQDAGRDQLAKGIALLALPLLSPLEAG